MAIHSWQEDWNSFVDLLIERLQSDDGNEELAAIFGGQNVTWRGRLVRKDLDRSLAPSVMVMMPQRKIDCGDGRTAIVDGIGLPVRDAVESWERIDIGTDVLFTARFIEKDSPIQPVEVKSFDDGLTVVFINLKNGVPIECAGSAILA